MSHDKKIAIITGSSKGIGRSIAEELATDTEDIIVIVTSRELERAQTVAKEIQNQGGDAIGLKLDIENDRDIEALINFTIESYGRLDILVNNAVSKNSLSPLSDASKNDIEKIFTANITNVMLLSKLAYPYLKKSQGCIINIASVIVNRHLLGLPFYAVIKGSIIQMTKVLAAEWGQDGIRVNAINPGFIHTSAFKDSGMSEELIEKSHAYYANYNPLTTIGKPSDIGNIAKYLTSNNARLITGSVIEVDAGYSIQGLPLYKEV